MLYGAWVEERRKDMSTLGGGAKVFLSIKV